MDISCLNSELFTISHLTLNDDLSHFTVDKNAGKGLSIYLKNQALHEEQQNKARTYLIRDAETAELVAYFTLKTGMMTEETSLFSHSNCSAIEIANLAVNYNYKRSNPNIAERLPRIGLYIFSQFVIPIVKEIQSLVGARYLQIYALPEKKLINHYEKMGFCRTSSAVEKYIHRHIKPLYDRGCIFMFQEI